MDLSRDDWLAALRMPEAEVPHAVVLEGSWWREQRTEWRLGRLSHVKELAFPDMFWGLTHGRPVVYSCVYGAPRAVELAHLFSVLGTRLVVTIGTCGALQPGLSPGDVVVPDRAVPQEGIAAVYGSPEMTHADPRTSARARQLLAARGAQAHDGLHLTWYSIFAQNAAMVEAWRREGYSSVDMEAATALAVASHFDVSSVAMLVVWDLLDRGTSFLDPLEPHHQASMDAANAAVWEVALSLVGELE
jgi:uridine phosphorylase